uniref:Uncharacterized protein n=1 Tax=Globodera rostochiensis TaxID=31243 RepID=A0A914GTM0_GLORO
MELEMDAHSLEQALVFRFVDGGNKRQRRIDTSAVARLVLDQCKPLITSDRLSELERLIFYLQKRHIPGKADSDPLSGTEMRAKLEDLENYMELLYEEGEPKQRGVALLSELVRHVETTHLAQIVENEQLMGALTRVWREDSRKNFELAIHLAQLFHRLSQFAPFHATLSHLKIGLLSVQMVEFELGRWDLWREQTREMAETERRKWEYAMRKQDQLIALVLRILLNLADDLRAEHKMLRKGLLPMLFRALEHSSSPQLLTAAVRFLWKLSQFAENQLYIGSTAGAIDRLVSLLAPQSSKAVAEDAPKGGSHLPLASSEFLNALCSLLFNCSFESAFRRNMVNAGLVSLLAPHISENDVTLGLLYQLSIVDDAKAMIAFTDCIPLLLNLLLCENRLPSTGDGQAKEERRRRRSLLVKSLLVNIMLEKRNAQLLCGSEGQGLDSLMAFALDDVDGDVLALKIGRNIVSHEGPTREMFLKWVPQLLENAIEKTQPPVPTNGNNCKSSLSVFFALECMAICAQLPNANWVQLEDSHEVVAFLARILRQIQRNGVDELSPFVDSSLDRRKVGERGDERKDTDGVKANKNKNARVAVTDDVLLQAVQWCGSLAGHSLEMAEKVERHLLPLVVLTLNKRQEDDEIVLQCVFVFVSLLAHGGELAKRICCSAGSATTITMTEEESRQQKKHNLDGEEVRQSSNVIPLLLLNLMHDRNPQMRALCEQALQLVAKVNAYWRERIQGVRFRWHNAQWLEMVQTPTDGPPDHLTTPVEGGHVLNSEQLLMGTEF